MTSRFRSKLVPKTSTASCMVIYRKTAGSPEQMIAAGPGIHYQYSQTAYCLDELHPGPPYKIGGPLLINTAKYPAAIYREGFWKKTIGAYTYRAEGGFVVNPYVITGIVALPIGTTPGTLLGGTASQYGSTAWNRYKPGKPQHSLGQALAEARSIPGMVQGSYRAIRDIASMWSTAKQYARIWKSLGGKRHIKDTPKAISNEFLNNQFGWVPFISDCQSLLSLCSKVDKDAIQLKRDNNQWVYREGSIPVATDSGGIVGSSTTASALEPSGYYYYPFTPLSSVQGSYTAVESVKTRCWFTAMFKYHIPAFDGPNWYWPALRRAYGLSLTPTLIYELTPWSWLIDWFSSAGDIISNLDSIINDGLVAKYAYIMMSKTKAVDVSHRQLWNDNAITATTHWEWSYKNRSQAPPYSFSWNQGELSSWQLAILTALGVSRLR